MMQGKVGAFFLGDKQIGGFFNWQLETHVQPKTDRLLWEAQANPYWFKRQPYDSIEVRFYFDPDLNYWVGQTVLKGYKYEPNTLIKESIEFSGQGILEAKTG
jgi:hypothetical protein